MNYIAFFRGINVGSKNRIKMIDLRELFSCLGYQNVKTYIQSGNVIFESNKQESMIMVELAQAFTERFGFESKLVLRTAEELATILADFPFTAAEIQTVNDRLPAAEHVYFYLSNNEVDVSAVEKLAEEFIEEDKVFVGKREIYFLSAQSIRNSKLGTKLAKLDDSFTVRNRKTLNKISELLTS
ncbi:DUF1697 domain-containing protein [Candidatus Enterococcus courvalinii]|uniref:DUF1697 domain-containing protein n=1 Tax=Candidatus Enterococcus courvalinii TaxID=2815329 RepID=A0ABS3I2V5_9ENTE|nr:DUF1697 domain-containing protein [Enterococcus sp. MSG2901]MBO0483040.1 DUF1697 domain-containing protein [Enterococcus sp. MSG2901]